MAETVGSSCWTARRIHDVRENHGTMPADAAGKRIRGVLRNGMRFGFEPIANAVPDGWAADGKLGCRWTLTGHPFDIAEFEVIR